MLESSSSHRIELVLRLILLSLLISSDVSAQKQGLEEALSSCDGITIMRVNENKLFLQADDGARRFLYEGKPRCRIQAKFLRSDRILVQGCSSKILILDQAGIIQFKIPNYGNAYFCADSGGKYFVAYQRGMSLGQQLGPENYDRMKLVVFITSSGKKILEYKWAAEPKEDTSDGQVYFSSDSRELFLKRASGTVKFALP